MKNKVKELKGFVVGVTLMALLSGTVVLASPVMQEIIFGVSVSLDGTPVNFEEDMRPFTMGGRTFLPVRAVADLFGAEVDFDEDTNTVLLLSANGAPAPAPDPMPADEPPAAEQPAPEAAAEVIRLSEAFFDGSDAGIWARPTPSVNILGTAHADVVQFSVNQRIAANSQYNLSGDFSRLTGIFGRVDGVGNPRDAVVTIYGDGNVLETFEFNQHDMPRNINIDVTGVQLLRIDVNPTSGGVGNRTAWAISADLQ